jgi:allantoin racemase
MKIDVIVPILHNEHFEIVTYNEFKSSARKETEIYINSLDRGPASIESMYDEYIASPWILEKVKEAQEKKFDAIIIDCMGDPALEGARELVDIPVVGPCQSSMALASTISDKFSVVTVLNRVIPMLDRLAKTYGFSEKLSSVRSVEIPVLGLENEELTKAALLSESKKAIEIDGADTIILGCTGMIGMAKALQVSLGVPVIDPAVASLKLVESLFDMKLSHSKKIYPYPPEKLRK